MQQHDPLGEGQAESVSLGGMGGIPLIKALEDVSLYFLAHADSGVRDTNADRRGGPVQADGDPAAFSCEFYGVVDQVLPDLRQKIWVPIIIHTFQLDIHVQIFSVH